MSTIIDKINKLAELKIQLVENLKAKGVDADNDETFNTLIAKVLEIKTSE